MAINQKRPDTPLAPTPDPTKPKTWNQMTYAERKAAQEAAKAKGGREGFRTYMDSVINSNFAEGAAKRGMTTAEYSKYLEKSNRRPDAPLEGLETGKACRRGSTKGSCSTGRSNRGESLRDNR
jgi:hypothetical protein